MSCFIWHADALVPDGGMAKAVDYEFEIMGEECDDHKKIASATTWGAWVRGEDIDAPAPGRRGTRSRVLAAS